MPKLKTRLPAYRHHKGSGQALVTLNGRDFYLGPHGSAKSRAEYGRLTSEWLASGGVRAGTPQTELTVMQLLLAFAKHAKAYYVDPNGKPSTEYKNFSGLIARLRKAYGRTPAAEFGPLRLKAFRQSLIEADLARGNINHHINRVRQIFKWGAENELIPPSVVEALRCVAGLRYGKSEARETAPIRPVPDAFVDAVLPYLPPQIAAMIELQRVTGMRSGEVCAMRMADVNTSGSVWTYTPARHKTQYRGHSRIIYLGPKAQAIVGGWFRSDLAAPLFQPADAQAWRREQHHAARKTPLSCGNTPGSKRVAKPRKQPGSAYTPQSYARAVIYALAKCNAARTAKGDAEISHWHPHQLRHNAATMFRRQHGLEVARVLLGHKHASMTELYADVDRARAVEVVAKIG